MDMPNRRIVILGKTGVGKSSLANIIFGEKLFNIGRTANSETEKCKAETKSVNGRSITLIDTPGFFDTKRSEKEMKAELVRCITECSPGPHAFLIVLKVERFTEQEQAVINKIKEYFSEEAFKYAVILFTHGDDLEEDQKIHNFVSSNKLADDLVKKCGGRCHVIDNKRWNESSEDEYRSNKFQVEELLKSVDKMLRENKEECYTNELLQAVGKQIQQKMEDIRQTRAIMSATDASVQARDIVHAELVAKFHDTTIHQLLKGFFGSLSPYEKVALVALVGGVVLAPVAGLAAVALGGAVAAGALAADVLTRR